MKTNKHHSQLPLEGLENLEAPEYDESKEHPTPEQLIIRLALKRLTPKQKKVWELYNYDRFTQDEIGAKLNISQPVVAKHLRAIEKKIKKWCNYYMGAYELLKTDYRKLD